MYPDEIIMALGEEPSTPEIDPGLLLNELEKAWREGKIQIPGLRQEALPVFAAGLVGGALGAKLLKGTIGLLIGGAIAWWAYSRISRPVTLPVPGEPDITKIPGSQTHKTPKKLPSMEGWY